VAIEEIPTVVAYETPQEVQVKLTNAGQQPLRIQVELKNLVDQWQVVGDASWLVRLGAQENTTVTFQIAAGRQCHSAHYPVHVFAKFQEGEQAREAHAVRIFETNFATADGEGTAATLIVQRVPSQGALPLATLNNYRIRWSYYDQELETLPVGWQGSEPTSRASFRRGLINRGEDRLALQIHPPYRPQGGPLFAEYRLQLPDTQPLKLAFFNAIRDHSAQEPPSDGVTFRVWVDDQQLFERHTDAKQWVDGEADLSPFAGREILLRLESHPGPNRNTVCDSCYWGDPVVIAGNPVKPLTDEERDLLRRQVRTALADAATVDEGVFAFDLGSDGKAALALGRHGLADGVIAFGSPEGSVVFDGLDISIHDQRVGRWPTALVTEKVETRADASGRLEITHHLLWNDEPFPLRIRVRAEPPGLRIQVDSKQRITDLAFGPADCHAPRVYYGHGFCVVEPEAFRAGGGGHNLATSHVGFDFSNGVSLLMACDTPPDYLQVDPQRKLYTLHAHPETTFTCVPGKRGAMDCAIRYRPLYNRQPAPGVRRKAGRFCFDIWGGRYADNTRLLDAAFRYGLTDALLIMHVWQRWGYDYRLPDIYPPNADLGTVEDLQALADLCARHGVLWGLHDNYIDFYPDADEFSYEHIVFTAEGRPQKAWINTGRDAQSYRFRPDHIQPFVERNLDQIVADLPMTSYFIDVFTSANCFDFYDRQGDFHSNLETRRHWGEAFAWIRELLGENAPMVSEAGSDQLIGYIDGADCQFLQIGPRPRRFHLNVSCQDWERVPWFDAVNHTRMSLHGVGYSGRYQGGRSRALHGIESDDYISAELLTGHALMIDRSGLLHGAVRKYWLAQNLIRSLADDEIDHIAFADDDIHRIVVHWKSGGKVSVNRGTSDWQIAGRILPQFGYLAENGQIVSSIERVNGAIVEQSRSPNEFYVNARGDLPDAPLRIRPSASRVEYLGERKFKLMVDWQADEAAPKDLLVFVHFFQPQVSRLVLTGFYGGGGAPAVPTSQWAGRITTGDRWVMTLPEDCPPGEYDILVGLYDRTGRGRRYRLLGDEDPERRYRIGTLVVAGRGNEITGMSLEAHDNTSALAERLAATKEPVNFGLAKTRGGFRCQVKADRMVVTPLPGSQAFDISLDVAKILGKSARVTESYAVDIDGQKIRDVEFEIDGDLIRFSTAAHEFAYHLVYVD
jgi:hypothetical protein